MASEHQVTILPAGQIELLAIFFMEASSEPEGAKKRLFDIFITLANLAPKENALLKVFAVENIRALAVAIVKKLQEAGRLTSVEDVLTQERVIFSHVRMVIAGLDCLPDQTTSFNPLTKQAQEFNVRIIKRETIGKMGDIFHHLLHEALLQSHQMTKVPKDPSEVLA